LTVLFAGAPWAIVVMAATMEAAELVTAGRRRDDGGRPHRDLYGFASNRIDEFSRKRVTEGWILY
jgi:hypothetical protein